MGERMSSNKSYEWENVDDDFFIWLFSNDRDVSKVNDEDSIASHFKSKLPLDLDLRRGTWEMGVDKVILANEQNNNLDYRFKDPNDKVVDNGSLPEKKYNTKFEVIEEIYEIGKELRWEKTTSTPKLSDVLTDEDLKDEKIGFIAYDEGGSVYRLTDSVVDWVNDVRKASGSSSYSLKSTSLWDMIYDFLSKKYLSWGKIPDKFSMKYYPPRTWRHPNRNQYLFNKNSHYPFYNNSITTNTPYSKFPNFDNTKQKYNIFRGMETYLKSIHKKMAIVIVASEKLAKALDLDTKSKFDSMGEFIIGFDKSKMTILSNVKNLSQIADTRNYIVLDTGLQSTASFTLEVNTHRLIPLSSTKVVRTIITKTKEKLIEIKNESGGGKKLKLTGSVELLEADKVKTTLKGEYDLDDFDFVNTPKKNLISEDVAMVKLSIPNITSLTPFYGDGKKKEHLFDPIIKIHDEGGLVFHQNKRERQMHKLNSLFTNSIEIDIESISGQRLKRPRFYYGITFVSLYFRKARSNCFEIL